MFTEIYPIVKDAGEVVIRLFVDSEVDGQLKIIVSPFHSQGKQYPGLNDPIMLTNTPLELDTQFAGYLANYAPAYHATCTQIADSLARLEAEKAKAKDAASKPVSKPAKPGGPAPKAPPPKAEVTATADTGTMSLFGDMPPPSGGSTSSASPPPSAEVQSVAPESSTNGDGAGLQLLDEEEDEDA